MNMEQRNAWNVKHRALNASILKPAEHDKVVELLLDLHGSLYSSEMAGDLGVHSEEILMENMTEELLRWYPVPCSDTSNSIAWHLWHMARVEDITMNILAVGGKEVLYSDNWLEKMNIRFATPGNEMNEADMEEFNSYINIESLLAYRIAVGRQTREIVNSLKPSEVKEKVQASRILRLFDEKILNEDTKWLADYWSKKKVAGLFLMPTTRHNFLHMNKSIRIKDKLIKMKKKGVTSIR
ncbi:DinB family protein [Paenibacillus sp. LMG 31461]|uniref:DinB family protein n=1 Tax=Paenibacillus plantarum TaxID=2654975 RepID=A0ABX1X8M4_9BACL|nr:DinB family protein [Paenibacillus plantarum]NOU64739.1 DinB family protein [Paenibacillus plantarum]